MKRAAMCLVVVILALLALAPGAWAEEQNQPGQGETSTGRNLAGFGGGPHCHVLVIESAQEQFTFIRVFPSHTGHAHAGSDVFAADFPDCDGLP
jgi:hypothetical protein